VRSLRRWFPGTERPLIITNMGGFSHAAPRSRSDRAARYERMGAALERVDRRGVEVIAQTMPPYPWLMGGQSHHNLFIDPDDTVQACVDLGLRLCFDTSHTKLAANDRGDSFHDWAEALAPHTAHLHVVDARGVDGEGLQIGEGEIDFGDLGEVLDRHCPHAGFIPEVWQGHQNGGEGFWTALDRLEGWL
jgi:sugar phosphate isomerase/epimerase